MGRFAEGFSGLIAIALMVGSFCLWCYGIAICWQVGQFFWGVVSFVIPPIGFLIGSYNFLF